MKKLNTKIALVIAGLLGAASTQTYAADSADLTLTGTVEQDCGISLDASSYTVDLVNGEADSTVATVTESCNDADGFIVSFSSSNGGYLQNDDNADQQKNYTISYGSGAGSIDQQSLSEDRSITYSTFTASNSVPLKMDLAEHGSGVLAAGTWSDVITVSIAAQ